MSLLNKKICMIGDFAVGKSSLVSQFVNQQFSQKYQTTVGVKIDTKLVELPDFTVKLIIWDLAGADNLKQATQSYLQGMSGYILVAYGTRAETLETALSLKKQIDSISKAANRAELPFVGLINKTDLPHSWDVPNSQFDGLLARGWDFFKTSALDGTHVEQAFRVLAKKVSDDE